MIPNKVAVCSRTFSKNSFLRKEMEKRFSSVKFNDEGLKLEGSALIDYLKDMDGAIVALEKIKPEIIKELPELKVVSKYGVGLDNIDTEALKKSNIYLGWSGGVNRRSVSELTLGLMLSGVRRISRQNIQLKNGEWSNLKGRELSSSVVGIIGAGFVGCDVIELLKPFGCEILVNDIKDVDGLCLKYGVKSATKDEIFSTCDVVSIHTPLTDLTNKLVDKDVLEKMRSNVVLINTSRGSVVDEDALAVFLKNNPDAFAALDVFEEEPPGNSSLLGLENFEGTPHIGGSSIQGVHAMGMSAVHHLESFFKE